MDIGTKKTHDLDGGDTRVTIRTKTMHNLARSNQSYTALKLDKFVKS